MDKSKDTIRLLILDTSQNDAEELINLLRNAGHATQAQMIESESQFQELLNSKRWDLCFAHQRATTFNPFQVLAQIKKLEQDIPTIMLVDSDYEETLLPALEAGMRDVVQSSNQKHLLLAALRELDGLTERRQRRRAEIGLKEAEKRCRLLLDSSKDAIAYVHEGMHIYANKVYVKLFGYPDFDELEGMPLMDMVASQDQEGLKSFLKSYSDGSSDSDSFDCTGVRDDDTEFEAQMSLSAARYDGESCTQIVIRTGDAAGAATDAGLQDIITGLQNLSSLLDRLDKAVEKAAENHEKHALLYIQLDDFIPVKNRIGPANTNLLLSDVAKTLQESVSEADLLARVDDISFAALLAGQEPDAAAEKAKQICQAIAAKPLNIAGEKLQLSASVGVALVNETTLDAKAIITKAREAAGFVTQAEDKTCVHIHNEDDQDAAQKEKIIKLLETALEKNLFKLVFQPIVSLRGDSGEHYEALLRMPDEDGNDISPVDFLNTAADKGLTRQIDRWVIEESIQKLKGHLEKGHKTHVFINLTSESILDQSLLPDIGALLNEARMPGDSIIFQISETDATAHLTETKEFVKGVNQLHCKVALTHFGRALNPFNALKHLPVSYVKIDGSFITELSKNEESKDELKTLISSLHTQGKLTVAPLVDTASLLPSLWQAGINYIQGYYIQQPSQNMDYDFSTEDEED